MRNRTSLAVILLLAVSLAWAFAAPVFAAQPERGSRFEGNRFDFLGFPELDEGLHHFSLTAYDGQWRITKGETARATVIEFGGQWSTCEPYANPEIPAADAVIRVYDWHDTDVLDTAGEGTVVFTDDGYGGSLDIAIEIDGTYREVPAVALGPPEDPFTTCEGAADPVVVEPIQGSLVLDMEWESSLKTIRGNRLQWESTTVTAIAGSFGGRDLVVPHGDSEDYYARSGPYTGFVPPP